jgi:hypothetical protein
MISDFAQNSLDWARGAITAHKDVAGLEGDDEVQIWHLLVSLIVFCQVQGIDFDATVAAAKMHVESDGVS